MPEAEEASPLNMLASDCVDSRPACADSRDCSRLEVSSWTMGCPATTCWPSCTYTWATEPDTCGITWTGLVACRLPATMTASSMARGPTRTASTFVEAPPHPPETSARRATTSKTFTATETISYDFN